jgi:hypothetical protein
MRRVSVHDNVGATHAHTPILLLFCRVNRVASEIVVQCCPPVDHLEHEDITRARKSTALDHKPGLGSASNARMDSSTFEIVNAGDH